MKDFSKIQFRASQSSKLMTGSIGLTDIQEKEMRSLCIEKDSGINVNGNKIKWTDSKQDKLTKLQAEFNNPTLPKTMQTELRKIYRAEKFNRNFNFSTKYTSKGVVQEDESITTYQNYLNKKGIRTYFVKNGHRLYNEYFQGEPDLNPVERIINGEKLMVGFDVKTSWSLESFPFPEDSLIDAYEMQNQVYMNLTGADMWITATILVNCTEQLLNNEKLKRFYELGAPDENHKYYPDYIKSCRDSEKQLIFDYDRFVDVYPYHMLEWTRKEWMGEENDIPLSERVLEKVSYRDEEKMIKLIERAKIGRKYLAELQKQDENKLILI